jgi:hypothetical protein
MNGPDIRPARDGTFDSHVDPKTEAAFRAIAGHTLGPHLEALRGNGDVDAATLRDAIRTVCAAARTQLIPPERVIIALKDLWGDLPRSRDRFRTGGTTDLLERTVTMALDEYYRLPAPPT